MSDEVSTKRRQVAVSCVNYVYDMELLQRASR